MSQPRIEIGAETRDAYVICHVRDNGAGVDPAYQAKVFGLFEQIDRSVGGTGIGLALVKRIVESAGGKAWMESDGVDQGATFYFSLPEANVETHATERKPDA